MADLKCHFGCISLFSEDLDLGFVLMQNIMMRLSRTGGRRKRWEEGSDQVIHC
jgi:hypothetical protein